MARGLPDPDAPDSDLVARVIASDDRAAFTSLVTRHQGGVRTLLRRLARGDHALADDLAQATFLRVYSTLHSFRGDAEFRSWLYRIACNEFFQHRRLYRNSREVLLEEDVNHIADATVSSSEALDLSIDLERALASLGEAERDAIVVCYYADLSHSEAALVLNCALGTLKSHVQRGRTKLAAYLTAWAPELTEELK